MQKKEPDSQNLEKGNPRGGVQKCNKEDNGQTSEVGGQKSETGV